MPARRTVPAQGKPGRFNGRVRQSNRGGLTLPICLNPGYFENNSGTLT
jgi:hypothetical protein